MVIWCCPHHVVLSPPTPCTIPQHAPCTCPPTQHGQHRPRVDTSASTCPNSFPDGSRGGNPLHWLFGADPHHFPPSLLATCAIPQCPLHMSTHSAQATRRHIRKHVPQLLSRWFQGWIPTPLVIWCCSTPFCTLSPHTMHHPTTCPLHMSIHSARAAQAARGHTRKHMPQLLS